MEPTTVEQPDTQLITWSEPSAGLWVASTLTEYIGMVDRRHGGFIASGSTGGRLGAFNDPHAAKLAVLMAWGTGAGAAHAERPADGLGNGAGPSGAVPPM